MQPDIQNIELTYLTKEDYPEFKEAMIASYSSMPNTYWQETQIDALLKKFPDGQVVIKINNKIAGGALSIIIDYNKFEAQHTYRQITGQFTFNTHTATGDTLYGIDVFIRPEFRGLRLGRRLYEYRKELCEKLNLKSEVKRNSRPRS